MKSLDSKAGCSSLSETVSVLKDIAFDSFLGRLTRIHSLEKNVVACTGF